MANDSRLGRGYGVYAGLREMNLSLAVYGGEASLQMCASLDGLRSLLGYMPDLRTFNLYLL